MTVLRVALLAAVSAVGGCSASSGSSDRPPSLTPTGAQPSRLPDDSPATSPGTINLPAATLDPVVAEIASLAGVPTDQVVVVSAEPVTFPDGGLGCPEPGMAYPQVLVDGYKIVAMAGRETYDYRGSAPGTFRRCKTPG